jgi:hypothetical protein
MFELALKLEVKDILICGLAEERMEGGSKGGNAICISEEESRIPVDEEVFLQRRRKSANFFMKEESMSLL